MDLKYLQTFKTILRTGSFQGASRELNYAPSTVTFHIQQLEEELQLQLFEKVGRKMVLTQAGESVLPHVDAILHAMDSLYNCEKEMNELKGTLVVSMPETLLIYKMQPVLKRFKEAAPQVKLSILIQDCDSVRAGVLDGSVDIGIHYDVGGEDSSIVSTVLSRFKALLIASPEEDPEVLDFTTPGQKKTIDLISYYPDSVFQEAIDHYLKERDIVLNCSMQLWSAEAIKKNVMSRMGVAYLPEFALTEELAQGTLIPVATELDEEIIALYAYHKNKYVTKQMQLFLSLIEEVIG